MDEVWDKEKVATLLSLKARGLNMREIDNEMRLSRNAVIGKLARIRNTSFREEFRIKERVAAAPPPAPAEEPAPPAQPLPPRQPASAPMHEFRPKRWNSRLSYEETRPYHDRLKVGMRVRTSEAFPYKQHAAGVVIENDRWKPYAKVRWDNATCDHILHKSFIEPDIVNITQASEPDDAVGQSAK